MSYNPGAEIMWGSGGRDGRQTLVGASSYEAGVDARVLTEEAIILRRNVQGAIKEDPKLFPREYINALNSWLSSWSDFVRRVSGVDIALLNLPKQAGLWLTVRWYGPEIYNAVQDYRARFIKLWSLASKVMGKDATAFKPADPKPKVSTAPVTDAIASVLKGAMIVGGLGLGAYLLVNWMGRPKARVAPAVEE